MISVTVLVSLSNRVQRWRWGTWFQTPLPGHTPVESSGRTGSLLSLFQGRLTLEARNRIQKFRLAHKVQYYCTYGCVQSATYYKADVNKYQFLMKKIPLVYALTKMWQASFCGARVIFLGFSFQIHITETKPVLTLIWM